MRRLPEDFRKATRHSFQKAKTAILPGTKIVLLERAKVLMRTALEHGRAWANLDTLRNGAWSVSRLDDLKIELSKLKPAQTIGVKSDVYVRLLRASPLTAQETQRMLMREFNCEVQFRGDGMVWFVKNSTSETTN
jgi:hypothetical protein